MGVAAAGTGVAAASGLAWLFWDRNQEQTNDFGGIACPEVVRLGPEYAKGELNKELTEKIRIHIALCPNCGPYYRSQGWAT